MRINSHTHIKHRRFASALAIVVLVLAGTVATTSSATAEVGDEAIYTVTKTANPPSGSSVTPGQVITYTITASSSDGSVPGGEAWNVMDDLSQVLNNATLVEPLPAGLDRYGDYLEWNFTSFGEGENQRSISFQVRVNDDADGAVLTNVVAAWLTSCEPRAVRMAATAEEGTPSCSTTHQVIAVAPPAVTPAAPAVKPHRVPRSLPHTGA
jgi:hypothetical protein